MNMNEPIEERTKLVESQTRETGDHFHGHDLPWEMAKVAAFGDCTLIVWASDRREEPHFHVVHGENLLEPESETYLKIRSAEYLPHEGKQTGYLEDGELESLVELLKAKDGYAGGKCTVWQSLIGIWNRNNETRAIPVTTPMPDYRRAKWRLPDAERPPRGTTPLPDGGKMIYNGGDLTVVDKDGDLVSWLSSDLLAIMWGDDLDDDEDERSDA